MTTATASATKDKYLMLVAGEKGGVGKTQAAKFISHTLNVMGVDFYPVECDRANPDLFLAYGKGNDMCKMTFFSENERKENIADQLYELALEKSLVVSLPAQVYNPLKSWLDRNNVVEELEEKNIGIVIFFVSNGSKVSVDLFMKSLREMGENIPHVLVKNMRMRDNWDRVDNRIIGILEKDKIERDYQEVELPIIGYDEQDIIDGDNKDNKILTFTEAINSSYLGLMTKNRVKKALGDFKQDFESLGYFDGGK